MPYSHAIISGIVIKKKLIEYTKYVAEQQTRLMDIEEEKDRLENTFFKDNKDSNSIITH